MGTVEASVRRIFGRRPRAVVEPHMFVASIALLPTQPSRGGSIGEPVTVSSIRCNRSDCGRPRQDPVHHLPED